MRSLNNSMDLKRQGDRRGYILIALVLVATVAIVAGVVRAMPLEREAVSGCLRGSKAASMHLAVIDISDPIPEADRAVLNQMISGLADGLAVDERLQVLGFDGRDAPPVTSFDKCKLVEGKAVSFLTANVRKTDTKFKTVWLDP